jgi:hypothetical protein
MHRPVVTFWQSHRRGVAPFSPKIAWSAPGHGGCSGVGVVMLRAVCVAVTLFAGEASAQVFTMPVRSGSPRESEPGGVGSTLQPTQPIGRRDFAREQWSFVVNYAGLGNATRLEYWIGVDQMSCATAANRYPVSSGTPRCWPVSQNPSLTYLNPTVPLSYTVRINSRYLVAPLTGAIGDLQTTQGNVATNYLTLIASPPSDNNVVATYPISYDIEPPQTPTDVTLSAGEGSVSVRWNYAGTTTTVADGGTSSSVPRDLQGFWLLCDPPPGGATSADAGAADGGRDASVGLDVESDEGAALACGTESFAALDPNDDDTFRRYRCSDLIGPASTRGTASGLSNGVAYRVAVVAQDLAGNRSTLALPTTCVRPQPLTDFWEYYRGAGGAAEPIGCSTRPGARGAGLGLAIGAMMLMAWKRRGRRRMGWAAGVVGAVALALAPSAADAQTFEIFGNSRAQRRWESPQNFLFELRGGAYYPDVDGEFAGRATPFADMFGTHDRLLLSAELDWQALRIHPVGSLGIAVSAGYTTFGAVAPITQSPMSAPAGWNRPSGGEETVFHVVPGFVGGVFRVDALARHTVVPLVPYVKFGLGYAYWWSTLGGTLSRRSLASSPNARAGDADLGVAATGLSLGTHLAVGLMFRLDFLERRAQQRWDAVMGVNHSYLFGEYTRADVGTGGTQLQLSTSTWNAGLAFEF